MQLANRDVKMRSEKLRLPLPSRCPLPGILLQEEQFYLQSPDLFAHLFGKVGGIGEAVLPSAVSGAQLFARDLPLQVEFCSGNGVWIADRAEQLPHLNWLAVERRLDRASKIWRRKKRLGLTNLAIACANAKLFCHMGLGQGQVDSAHINFPDPWPKPRHAKHRLLSRDFLRELQRILRPGGTCAVVSDDAPLLRSCRELLEADGDFVDVEVISWPATAPLQSYFESLWRSKGREIYRLQCWRRDSSCGDLAARPRAFEGRPAIATPANEGGLVL